MPETNKSRSLHFALILLLSTHASLVGYSGLVHAPVMDELGHLAAGVSHWEFGRFGVYTVNPPLVRMVAAISVLAAGATTDWSNYFEGPGARPEVNLGDDSVRANGPRSFWLFTLARWGTIPLSLVGAWVCYLWARDLFGETAGVAALALWCFSPSILIHAAIITLDLCATALGVAAKLIRQFGSRTPRLGQSGFALFQNWRICSASSGPGEQLAERVARITLKNAPPTGSVIRQDSGCESATSKKRKQTPARIALLALRVSVPA